MRGGEAMAWQPWVLIAVVATVLALLAVVHMRRARRVFDDITQIDRPAFDPSPRGNQAEISGDELGRARARYERPEPARHRKHG